MTSSLIFIALTFAISLVAFVGIATLPAAHSPENLRGLPVWLLAVWGPTLAALILSWREGTLQILLARAVQLHDVSALAWLAAIAPLALLIGFALAFGKPDLAAVTPGTLMIIIAFNLILGPLGEELGWRGFLQTRLQVEFGWLGAALAVGLVWWLWHLPLWLVDSPQREIPIVIFAGHVFAYAIILGAAQIWASGSIAPAIVFHLMVNATAAVALLGGFGTAEEWYRATLLPYAILALGMTLLTTWLAPCPNGACELPVASTDTRPQH